MNFLTGPFFRFTEPRPSVGCRYQQPKSEQRTEHPRSNCPGACRWMCPPRIPMRPYASKHSLCPWVTVQLLWLLSLFPIESFSLTQQFVLRPLTFFLYIEQYMWVLGYHIREPNFSEKVLGFVLSLEKTNGIYVFPES